MRVLKYPQGGTRMLPEGTWPDSRLVRPKQPVRLYCPAVGIPFATRKACSRVNSLDSKGSGDIEGGVQVLLECDERLLFLVGRQGATLSVEPRHESLEGQLLGLRPTRPHTALVIAVRQQIAVVISITHVGRDVKEGLKKGRTMVSTPLEFSLIRK